jgi:hypothetical protein
MNLEQTTRLVLAAVDLQDLGALEVAGRERAVAIAVVASLPATEDLRAAAEASFQAGEEAKHAIRLIKQRIRKESRRLDHIETGFLRALQPAASHRVDCTL